MTTNRTPLSRSRKPPITPEMVDLFIVHEKRPRGKDWAKATSRLSELLGAATWQTSGCDATGPEPPPEMVGDRNRESGWRRSWDLRCALEAAVAKRKATA